MMYLIHFYIKYNIKMHLPKAGFLKLQNIRHYPSESREIYCVDIIEDFTTMQQRQI